MRTWNSIFERTIYQAGKLHEFAAAGPDALQIIRTKGVASAIKAAIDLVSEDHVSLGSDYDGTIEVEFDTSELSALTHELLAQGLNEMQIKKVMGSNKGNGR